MGRPPFGHAGEEALDESLRERFETGFRHNEQSLRIAESLNLTAEVRDGILKHTGPEARDARGRIVRIVDRVAYINHDIDDAVRHGILDPADLPQEEVELLGPRDRSASTHSSTTSSRPPSARVTSARARRSGRRCSHCAPSCSSASTWGRTRLRSTSVPHGGARDLRAPRRARRRADRDRRLRCRHDRSLRARLRGGPVMARIKDESVEAVKAAANIVELVEARVRLRKVGGRYSGLCPFHQEKTPSFSVSPDRRTYHCFGCGVGGDSISFVRETESLDFVGAIQWLAERFRVRSSTRTRASPDRCQAPPPSTALRAPRPGGVVLRARSLGDARR